MYSIILLRHGQSEWNRDNRFTGWTDVGLSEKGIAEARSAGRLLKKEGYSFDLVFSSVLKRALGTAEIVLEEMGISGIEIRKTWRLNERHYGALQGLNKAETARKYGEEQVLLWRRGYDIRPPALAEDDTRHPGKDKMYAELSREALPAAESLKETVARVVSYWHSDILPAISKGKKVLVSAHGNSIRALVKHIDSISEEDIMSLNIPTGIPLVYELDENMRPVRHYYLGDPAEVRKAEEDIKKQGKAD